ncbi:hypothetical protein AOA12_02065 [Microbacterium sp. No. 7]|nr:hypothetical protein AOA12_02065 [Microbacterium sp. No. 7]
MLALVGILLGAAFAATAATVYERFYSPAAFVEHYLDLLGQGRAAEALEVPGVRVGSAELGAAGLPQTSSDALLRRDALAPLTDVRVTGTAEHDGVHEVTVAYTAGVHSGTSTFSVEPNGWIGVAPAWRFMKSPLAVIDLAVRGSMQFSVNGFTIDKRQISVEGSNADPLTAVPMLVFSPGLYSITVDTAVSHSAGVAVLSDSPLKRIPVEVQTEPTQSFIDVVQEEVESFLTRCATQRVLQPTGCPFGYEIRNRIVTEPEWSIAQQPTVTIVPDGGHWAIMPTEAIAHLAVDVMLIADGTIIELREDVPFSLEGTIEILPDGRASIEVSAAG